MSADEETGNGGYSPRPGTTAALEQRVARLEKQYDGLTITVQSMSLDVAVTRTKMEGVEKAVADLKSTITSFITFAQTSAGDPSATPAGKMIEKQLADMAAAKDTDHKKFAEAIDKVAAETMKNRLWIAGASAIVAFMVLILPIVAPLIRHALGIPLD